jgi:PhnB protein
MKATTVYLNFDGNCREAMKFYQRCFDGELSVMTFAEMPEGGPKEAGDRLMHARLTSKSGSMIVLMASDIAPGMTLSRGNNFWIAVACETAEETDQLFGALSENGRVVMAPQETFWSPRFAMLTDQFDVNWMLNFEKPEQA